MKKFLTVITIAIALMASVSCGNRSSEAVTDTEVEVCDTAVVDTAVVDMVAVDTMVVE